MLGRGKINFESPNVIDPGDQPPPSRSSRRESRKKRHSETSSEGKVRERPNYTDREDPRKQNKPSRNLRSIKLPLQPSDNIEPNPQSDDVGSYTDDSESSKKMSSGQHQSRPSFSGVSPVSRDRADSGSPGREATLIFAEIMLAETERRLSKRNLMNDDNNNNSERSTRSTGSTAMQWPRRGRRNEFRGLRHVPSLDEDDDSNNGNDGLFKRQELVQRRRRCLRALVVLVVVAMIAGFSVIAYQSVHKSRTTGPPSSDRLDLTLSLLVENGISKASLLEDQSSPQYKAARWIAMHDGEQLDIPMDLEGNPYEFVQRYALAVLYFAMNGPKWSSELRFLSDLHECSWYESIPDENEELAAVGVTCDENLQVRNLLIPRNNLKGQIPEEIAQLTRLDFLSLKYNYLTGSIPRYFDRLTLLDYLDLKYNSITGTIPDFLGDLERLEVLGLSNNQLTGSIPSSLGALPLKTLAIDDNLLTGDMSAVALMTSLQYLYAENNRFKGSLDNGLLADLARLVEVDLSGNEFEGHSIPRYLFIHPHLRVLDLHNNLLEGTLPTILVNSSLRYLSLRENNLSSSIPAQIQNLAALTHLDLEANALTGTLPAEALGKMTSLSYLFLGKNPMAPSVIPDELRSLKSLRELSLDGLQLTGPIPAWIENFSNLRLLDLRSNSLTGSVPIDFANLQGLSYLLLSDNLLTGPVPQGLGSRPELQVVSLHHTGIIGEVGLLCSAQSGVQLLTTDCGAVTCTCCEACCESEDCYSNVLWDTLENSQGDWEGNFERSNYGFSPHILYGGAEPKGRRD